MSVPRTPPRRASARGPYAPGDVLAERYRIDGLLGVGGSGVVYAAEHVLTGQALAVKAMLDPESGARLEREAKSLARLRSPHVVRVIDLGHDDEGPFLVMERLEGATLRELLARAGRLPLGVVASLVLQVADALDEAHAADLVHRDLKPENVRLRHPSGRDVASDPRAMDEHLHATLFDFGIVKPLDELGPGITGTHTAVGTPNYMSLEQLRGDPGLDERSDVFALSVLVYECLTGELPFAATALSELVHARLHTTPARLDTRAVGVPEPLADVIARGLAPNPEHRPGSVRALAGALAPYAPTSRAAWLARSRDPSLPPSLAAPGHIEPETPIEASFAIGAPAASRHPTPTQLLAIDHTPPDPGPPPTVDAERSTPSAMGFPPLPPGLPAFIDTGELPPMDPRSLPPSASGALPSMDTGASGSNDPLVREAIDSGAFPAHDAGEATQPDDADLALHAPVGFDAAARESARAPAVPQPALPAAEPPGNEAVSPWDEVPFLPWHARLVDRFVGASEPVQVAFVVASSAVLGSVAVLALWAIAR